MKKVLVVLGTRPEAIKLAPVIMELKKAGLDTKILVTAQHRELLDDVLKIFYITPDYDLDVMRENQSLNDITASVLNRINPILGEVKPDLLLVQGDTTTAFAAALAGFYAGIKIGHVEAGLRTYDKYSPFPEEINRQIISRLADVHFAPTESAKKNLLDENVPSEKIYVVGNTEIDSLLWILDHQKQEGGQQEMGKVLVSKYGLQLDDNKKIILVTAHRRESFGQGLKNICEALREISIKRNDVIIIYTVHPNPNVRKTADSILRNSRNIQLVSPFDYSSFAFLMNKSHFILTDSGGIQEAAPFLNKPVLVMREKTERQEGVEIGASKIVGIDKDLIVESALELLDNKEIYNSMINKRNPYGDGHAAERIVGFIKKLI